MFVNGLEGLAAGLALLNGWTLNRTVAAIHAAITGLRFEPGVTLLAGIEILAGIGGHCLFLLMAAGRACDGRLELHGCVFVVLLVQAYLVPVDDGGQKQTKHSDVQKRSPVIGIVEVIGVENKQRTRHGYCQRIQTAVPPESEKKSKQGKQN